MHRLVIHYEEACACMPVLLACLFLCLCCQQPALHPALHNPIQAWGFRRKAYRQMLEVLLTQGPKPNRERLQIAQRMYEDVYGSESSTTQHLHQLETPPLTTAAVEAREALLSADMFLGSTSTATGTAVEVEVLV